MGGTDFYSAERRRRDRIEAYWVGAVVLLAPLLFATASVLVHWAFNN